jgi:hypothetical protein
MRHSNIMLSQRTLQSLRYLGGLLIILGFFVFGSCPVRNAISSLINDTSQNPEQKNAGNANVISNNTCTGYTSDEISLFYDRTSSVDPSLPLLAVHVTTLFPGSPLFNKINVPHDALSTPGVNSIPLYLRNRVLLI